MSDRRRLDREIFGLAIPALGALAADPLVSMVDTAFVGRLGVAPLAALGVNASVFAMTFVVFNFLAYGTTPLIARAVGEGDRERAGRLAVQALSLALIIGMVALALLQLMAGPILTVMGATGELRDPAMSYLRIRALAGPAVLIITASHGIFRGWLDTRTPLVVTLAMNGVNLVLDPLLIFGLGWGLEGAAIATAVAQWSGALFFVWMILRSRREALGIPSYRPTLRDLLPLIRVGGALVTRTMALVGAMTLATAVATRLGPASVAAHQVASQLWLFLALLVDSLAVAAQAMVASRPAGQAREAADRILMWAAVVGGLLAVLFLLGRPWLPLFFTNDPVTIRNVDRLLPFVIWMQPLNAVVFVWDGVFMGAEDFRYLAVQMLISATAGAALLLLVVPMGWGLAGVWWGIVILMASRGVTLGARYFTGADGRLARVRS